MLPGASTAAAQATADALRESFTELLQLTCGPVRSGGSIGVALASPGSSPDDVIAEADAAMYRARPSGKRRTRAQDSPRSTAPAIL
jgi:GGDEF domain-containing protein